MELYGAAQALLKGFDKRSGATDRHPEGHEHGYLRCLGLQWLAMHECTEYVKKRLLPKSEGTFSEPISW